MNVLVKLSQESDLTCHETRVEELKQLLTWT